MFCLLRLHLHHLIENFFEFGHIRLLLLEGSGDARWPANQLVETASNTPNAGFLGNGSHE